MVQPFSQNEILFIAESVYLFKAGDTKTCDVRFEHADIVMHVETGNISSDIFYKYLNKCFRIDRNSSTSTDCIYIVITITRL